MERQKKQSSVKKYLHSISPISITKWVLIISFVLYFFLNQAQFFESEKSFQNYLEENPRNALGMIVVSIGILSAGILQVLQKKMNIDDINKTIGSLILMILTLVMIFSQNYIATTGMIFSILKYAKVQSFHPKELVKAIKESNISIFILASLFLCFMAATCYFIY